MGLIKEGSLESNPNHIASTIRTDNTKLRIVLLSAKYLYN